MSGRAGDTRAMQEHPAYRMKSTWVNSDSVDLVSRVRQLRSPPSGSDYSQSVNRVRSIGESIHEVSGSGSSSDPVTVNQPSASGLHEG